MPRCGLGMVSRQPQLLRRLSMQSAACPCSPASQGKLPRCAAVLHTLLVAMRCSCADVVMVLYSACAALSRLHVADLVLRAISQTSV